MVLDVYVKGKFHKLMMFITDLMLCFDLEFGKITKCWLDNPD